MYASIGVRHHARRHHVCVLLCRAGLTNIMPAPTYVRASIRREFKDGLHRLDHIFSAVAVSYKRLKLATPTALVGLLSQYVIGRAATSQQPRRLRVVVRLFFLGS